MTTVNFREPGEFGEGATMTTNTISEERLREMLAECEAVEALDAGDWPYLDDMRKDMRAALTAALSRTNGAGE